MFSQQDRSGQLTVRNLGTRAKLGLYTRRGLLQVGKRGNLPHWKRRRKNPETIRYGSPTYIGVYARV